ncbi:Septin-domain-containing protein [Scheffersomyces amazonensis]|uniref:Septin-domain-containing protein n=1 Tax=Scheffersomyces amazonensis TaxID=1078765 RepID=UPI00315D2FFE
MNLSSAVPDLLTPLVEETESSSIRTLNSEIISDTVSGHSLNSSNVDYHGDKIGLVSLPYQRTKIVTKRGTNFTIMLAGRSGLGKTSFLNSLLATDILDTTSQTSERLQVKHLEITENNFPLKLTVVETSGFGNYIDNSLSWIPLCNFIDEQFRSYLFQMEQPSRKEVVDSRVHCCLYFIPPKAGPLTPLDIESMKELSKRVNLIPIIAKGDTMSVQELNELKVIVKDTLLFNQIKVCNLIQDVEFEEDVKERIPFSIISSTNPIIRSDGNFTRGRIYPWGIVDIENSQHCDFIYLREILMDKHMLNLILSTEQHYENYRIECLSSRFKDAKESFNIVEDPKDGIQEYIGYNKISLISLELKLKKDDVSLRYKESVLTTKMHQSILDQESYFKEWKTLLVEEQKSLNNDIQVTHERYSRLKEEVESLSAKPLTSIENNEFATVTNKSKELNLLEDIE